MTYTYDQYQQSADYIREKLGSFSPKVAMILGSGLGFLGDVVESPLRWTTVTFPSSNPPPPPATRAGWCSAPCPASLWL